MKTLEEVGLILKGSFDGCTGCKKCQRGCPERALTVLEKGDTFEINVRSDLCLGTACQACELNCTEKVYTFSQLRSEI